MSKEEEKIQVKNYDAHLVTSFSFHHLKGFLLRHSSFIRPASLGETVSMDAEVIKTGESLAFVKADIFNSRGDILARGRHTLFVGLEKSADEKSFEKYLQ